MCSYRYVHIDIVNKLNKILFLSSCKSYYTLKIFLLIIKFSFSITFIYSGCACINGGEKCSLMLLNCIWLYMSTESPTQWDAQCSAGGTVGLLNRMCRYHDKIVTCSCIKGMASLVPWNISGGSNWPQLKGFVIPTTQGACVPKCRSSCA